LPTEAEWEKAARGLNANEWPWGNEFDVNKCNALESGIEGTTPVGKYSKQGDSPFGAADMAGNVWEWTQSIEKNFPYSVEDGREDISVAAPRVVRGGSFRFTHRILRAPFRASGIQDGSNDQTGFRLVLGPSIP